MTKNREISWFAQESVHLCLCRTIKSDEEFFLGEIQIKCTWNAQKPDEISVELDQRNRVFPKGALLFTGDQAALIFAEINRAIENTKKLSEFVKCTGVSESDEWYMVTGIIEPNDR